jgi:hypothetical protein
MSDTQKQITLDVSLLRENFNFKFLQLFELDSASNPTTFQEYRVPRDASVPQADPRFYHVSSLVMMRFLFDKDSQVKLFPKAELPDGWMLDIVAVQVTREGGDFVLLFYCDTGTVFSSSDLTKIARSVMITRCYEP